MVTKVSSITLAIILIFQFGMATAQDRVRLRISSAAKTLGYGPLWIGSRMGFFAKQGLDVDVVVIRASDVGIQALAGGSLEIAGSASDAPIAAIEKGLDDGVDPLDGVVDYKDAVSVVAIEGGQAEIGIGGFEVAAGMIVDDHVAKVERLEEGVHGGQGAPSADADLGNQPRGI